MTKASPAMKRYMKRLTIFMLIYIVLIFSVGYWFRLAPPEGALSWIAAILPALPILGVFWAIFRLLTEETDEFMRMMLVRQTLIATGFCLAVMTVWEFLQNYDVVPDGTNGFGTAFVWFVGLGIGAVWNAMALRREAGEE
ncbi:hypothetical protein [Altererythrobacter lutimaris]|uniref:Uncharacterized protein n=1 Tax=Altererythrobacter lutimaris TaxID=2743979 RepID=A0A850H7M1_9SPHN|nr:hypothetical protein [Altererythrobacter lutimaris]NVE95264.1 hypothetical protein [Altererythrobacter lutimaris]